MNRCTSAYTRVLRRSGFGQQFQVLYVQRDVDASVEPFAPLVQFFIDHAAADRISWQQEVCFAVGLLLDFVAAVGAGAVEDIRTDALRNFAESLVAGTANSPCEAVRALRWERRSISRAARLLSLITEFTDWLSNRTGRLPANPWRDAKSHERLVAVRRRQKASANNLLRHAVSRRREELEIGRVRSVAVPGDRGDGAVGEVKAFDPAMFPRLLMEGLGRRAPPGAPLAQRLRLRDALILLLMHGGGLRLSEAFHLWECDVSVESVGPSGVPTAIVRLFHPQRGAAPSAGGVQWRDREHCLAERWRMKPRNLQRGRFHAGWKKLALTDTRRQCARVEWFPSYWGEVFLALYRSYREHRPAGNHPFLFVSECKAHKGKPYTIAAFEQTLAAAVRRIGLASDKNLGTTAHGHRHAFGQALAAAGLDPLVIQQAFHHKSPDSQLVYTRPNAAQVNDELRGATERLWQAPPSLLKDIDK